MANRLRNYFPLIRERKEVLKEIGENSGLYAVFTAGSRSSRRNSLISVQG